MTASNLLALTTDVGFDRAVILSYRGLLYAIEILKAKDIGEHAKNLLTELVKLEGEIFKLLLEISGDAK